MKVILYIIIVILLSACNGNGYQITNYYDSGEILEKYIYFNKSDTSSYRHLVYYVNGNLKEEYIKENGLINGDYVNYFENGNIESLVPYIYGRINGAVTVFDTDGSLVMIKTYKNDVLHGLYSVIDPAKKTRQEVLNIQGVQMIRMDQGKTEYNDVVTENFTYYYMDHKRSLFTPVGTLIYNNYNGVTERVSEYCNYFETSAKDTILYGDTLNINISMYLGYLSDHRISLVIGEINSSFEFTDSLSTRKYEGESGVINLNITSEDYNRGVNLLTGMINVYSGNNDITRKYMLKPPDSLAYIFYRQFYVL